ncbi:MAG: ribosome small subunit-dependent GTPase A [Spirochaetes bacterium]|nr:ribosome small subunit-dependent GTPase A [Spirochaetota bacterium]
MSEGLVLWGVKSIYYVLDKNTGKEYKCLIKGKIIKTDFQIKGRKELNPIVVGDQVIFEKIDDKNGLIVKRKKRHNEFKRLKTRGRFIQTIFANIDCMIVVDSIANPPLRPYFIDRCLFSADYMGINAIIVFNKIDLLNNKIRDFYKKIKIIYQKLGYTIIESSTITKKGINQIKKNLKGKLSSLNGRSGVGKSSLIKTIDPQYNDIGIGKINKKYDRGIHTTSYSRIYPLYFDAMLIDTPGIRELAIFIDKPEDVEQYIRDFFPYRGKCKFLNCQHINEPDCMVIKALKNNKIESFRYESYLRIRDTIEKLRDSRIK